MMDTTSAAPAASPAAPRKRGLDWCTIGMVLPARRFTPQELQRAVPEPPSRSLKAAVVFNVMLPTVLLAVLLGPQNPLGYTVLLLALGVATIGALSAIWRDPGRRRVRWSYYALPFLAIPLSLTLKHAGPLLDSDAAMSLAMLSMVITFGMWFAIVYRHQYIVSRLRELDERDRAVDMARQLASAQIQPHFLFNSLASLQHWVHTRDERAGPMLDSLTAYLRATLPLFERQQILLREEFEAVRRYLEVMQARLGERLRFEVALPSEAGRCALPPGLLLTLVENAIEHGVQPTLGGGEVRVEARREADGRVVVEVRDTGPGLPPGLLAGVGLANTRQRLAQAFGDAAALQLENAATGGCIARLSWPCEGAAPRAGAG